MLDNSCIGTSEDRRLSLFVTRLPLTNSHITQRFSEKLCDKLSKGSGHNDYGEPA